MDHIIGISNKTCFSENKKAEQLGGKSTFDYIFMFYVDCLKKLLLVAVAVGNYFFYIQESWSYYLLYFQAKAGRLVFSKGIEKHV